MKNYKLQVMISDELKETLERISKKTGVSMSAMCNMWIAQGALSFDIALEKMGDVADRWIEENVK